MGLEGLSLNRRGPKPLETKEGMYQCPTDREIYPTKKDYEQHCKEKHEKTIFSFFHLF